MTKIILLVGRKGSGKDTFAEMLRDRLLPHDLSVRCLSFAGPIKETLATMFGFPDLSYFNDQNKKEKMWPEYCTTMTPRQLMVWFGTDVVRRQFGADFWIKRLICNIVSNQKSDVLIVTDTRFPNEVCAMEDVFGQDVTTLYIDSDERIGPLDHATASEPELAVIHTRDMLTSREGHRGVNQGYVHHIDNNSSPGDLKIYAKVLVDAWMGSGSST